MRFFLLHLKLNGIKNISKEIQLDFYNKVITAFEPDMFKVKAIYGENGSGKTALMTAISIAKKMILSPGYLRQTDTQQLLNELINKKNKELFMEFEFAAYDNSMLNVFRYSFSLTRNPFGIYELTREKLEVIRDYTRNKRFRPVYEINGGQIERLSVDKEDVEQIKNVTMNLLKECPFSLAVIESGIKDIDYAFEIVSVLLFFFSVNVYLDEEDLHEFYLINNTVKNLKISGYENSSDNIDPLIRRQLFYIDSKGRDIVDKKDFSKYKDKSERLTRYLKMFKSDLRGIAVEKRDNGEVYSCDLILKYDGYSVSREFESTGIKKLIRIFDSLVNADEGGISFIDEMDSNINAVYLCKMIEYFTNYGKGQLCFTTHNLDPMSVLKNNKNSIDFITMENKVVSWKVNGNAAPDRYYRNGMIEDMPFNIDAIDFIGIFGE